MYKSFLDFFIYFFPPISESSKLHKGATLIKIYYTSLQIHNASTPVCFIRLQPQKIFLQPITYMLTSFFPSLPFHNLKSPLLTGFVLTQAFPLQENTQHACMHTHKCVSVCPSFRPVLPSFHAINTLLKLCMETPPLRTFSAPDCREQKMDISDIGMPTSQIFKCKWIHYSFRVMPPLLSETSFDHFSSLSSHFFVWSCAHFGSTKSYAQIEK